MDMDVLFPEATPADIVKTKSELASYAKRKKQFDDFEKNPPESQLQQELYLRLLKFTRNIERAIAQILDADVKKIIEYRYVQGNSRAATIIRFPLYCEKTVDRKLMEGIESIANTLKYLE
ncbi:hypothetical protein [Paenibacillus gansuensis]|uniref:Uncharacterized protein n=1 Tax=Paenibacillus gansuensis TaxID=306542 RepID=A0ABW5PJG3_9BACL